MPRKSTTGATSEAPLDFSRSLQTLTPESFFRFIRQYPKPEGTQIYVYRVKPVIRREQAGISTSYIDSLAGNVAAAFDPDYLLRTHGSGRFHLKLSDANKPKGLTEVAKTTADVWDPAVEPILNPIELLVNSSDVETANCVQKYLAKGWTIQEVAAPDGRKYPRLTQPQNDSAAGKLADTVRDLAGQVAARPEGGSELVPLVRELVQQLRPTHDPLDRAFQIADRMAPKQDSASTQLVNTMGNLLVSRLGSGADPRPDPVAQLKETAALLKELGVGVGGGGESGGGSWRDALAALPGILQYGAMLFREIRLSAVQPEAQPGNVLTIDRQPEPAPPAPLPAEPVETEDEEMPLGLPVSIKELRAVGTNAIDAFDRGIEGDDFAHALVCGSRKGEQVYTALSEALSELGKEGILSAIGMIPGLADRLAPKREELETWIDKFCAYSVPPAA